jgi:hypothetical protein
VTEGEATVCSLWFPPLGPPIGSALPFTGSSEASSPAAAVLWRCATPWAPLAALRCLRLAIPCGAPVVSLPTVQTPNRGPGARNPVPTSGTYPQGGRQGLPGSRATRCPYALFFDPGRTACTRPLSCGGTAPARSTTKAPTTIHLSGLHSTAWELAVYASSGRLPAHDAKLASGCWPGSAGRGWLPAGLLRKVSDRCRPPFPSLPGARTLNG